MEVMYSSQCIMKRYMISKGVITHGVNHDHIVVIVFARFLTVKLFLLL